MKKFDKINFIGRVFIGIYFIIWGVSLFQSLDSNVISTWTFWFIGFMGFWSIIGGILLTVGLKPRAVAGVLAAILIVLTIVEIIFFANTTVEQTHIFSQFTPQYQSTVSNWASQQIHVFLGKLAILGACLFIAGTRTIPHCMWVRSESNMQNKYGA